MTLKACDSAYAPTLAEALAAKAAGIDIWFGYIGGAGALNIWTPAEFAILQQAGLRSAGVWVPLLDLSDNPVTEAQAAVVASEARGLRGCVVLDTEASMRGNPHLVTFVDGFTQTLQQQAWSHPVYGGGDYVPAGSPAWWIEPGAPPAGQARQYGGGSEDGASVDWDQVDEAFPLAAWTAAAPVPASSTQPEGDPDMLTSRDPIDGSIVVVDPTGAVFTFAANGGPGGHYLGGLNNHPAFQAGEGEPEGAPVAVNHYSDGGPFSAYVIITRDTGGHFHQYNFPSNGSLAS